MLVLKF